MSVIIDECNAILTSVEENENRPPSLGSCTLGRESTELGVLQIEIFCLCDW